MLKYVVATVVLILGFAVSALPAPAAPRNDDCVNCAPPKPYSEEPARIRQEMDRAGTPDANTNAPVGERAPVADRPADAPRQDCTDCPPPRRYDNTEVVKTSRDVDQSRVINTEVGCASAAPGERDQQAHHSRERNPQRRRDPAQSPDHRERNPLRETCAGLSAPGASVRSEISSGSAGPDRAGAGRGAAGAELRLPLHVLRRRTTLTPRRPTFISPAMPTTPNAARCRRSGCP